MSLLGVGSATRRRALEGFGAVADMDTRERAILENIEMQKRAQEGQTLGTAAGIGSMVGAKKLAAAQEPFRQGLAGLNKLAGDTGRVSSSAIKGGLKFTPTGGETIKGITDASQLSEGVRSTMAANQLGGAAATAESTAAATTAVEGAVSSTAAAGSGTTGLGATLGSLAAPIGIALGVGFLLNKLFD